MYVLCMYTCGFFLRQSFPFFCYWKMWFSIKFMFFLRITSLLTWVAYMCKYCKIYPSILEGFNIYFQKMILITIYMDIFMYLRCRVCNFEIFPTCKFFKNKYIGTYMHRNNCNFETTNVRFTLKYQISRYIIPDINRSLNK